MISADQEDKCRVLSERVWASVCIGEGGAGGDLHCATDLPERDKPPPPERAGLAPTGTRGAAGPAVCGAGKAERGCGGNSTVSPLERAGCGGDTRAAQPRPPPAAGARGPRAARPSTMQRTSGPFPTPAACPGGGGEEGREEGRMVEKGGPLPLLRKRNQSTVKDAALPSRKDIAHSERDCM